MTYSYGANAGDRTIKTFHLVKAGFNATYGITDVSNTNPIVITTLQAHGLTTGTAITIVDVVGSTTLTVTGATNTSPIRITTSTPHGLLSGQSVTIASVGGNTNANGTWVITLVDATKFTLNNRAGNSNYTTGGTVVAPHPLVSGPYTMTNTGTYTFTLDGITGQGTYVSGGTVLAPATQYWTDSDIPLTAIGHTWVPNGIEVGQISQQGTSVVGSSFSVQNADYQMSGLVYNPLSIRNVPIDIYEAWLDPTVTNASLPGGLSVDVKYLFSGIINNGTINRNGDQCIATYELALSVDQNAVILPRRLLTYKCTVVFKGPACQYAGAAETCTRTLANCIALGNEPNYGGFPTLPTTVKA